MQIVFGKRASPIVLAEVKQTEFLSHTPKKYKESVFEPPILLQNQANPQILLHF